MKIKNDIPNVNLSGKNIVITGATAGIGKETARSLAKMGANIFFTARSKKKTLNAIEEIRNDIKNDSVIMEHKFLDLMDLDSVRDFPSLLNGIDKIDVLINNAGVGHEVGVTKQGIERIFGISYLSHFLLTKELLPFLLKSGARIINVSSMGYMSAKRKHFYMPYKGECSQITPQQRYGRSKAAQILFTKALQRRFDAKNLSCTCSSLHPGGVRTNIFEKHSLSQMVIIWMLCPIMINAPEGAKNSVYLATTEKPERTGGKYFYYGLFIKNFYEKKGSALVNHEQLQELLWRKSEELIGEDFQVG